MSAYQFKTLTTTWKSPVDTHIVILSRSGHVLFKIPQRFLIAGSVNNWAYVQELLEMCVVEVGNLVTSDGQPVNVSSMVDPGTYTYHTESLTVTFTAGPAGKSKIRDFTGTSVGTMSDSDRSSALQNEFRVDLIARDFNCLLTGVPKNQCTPCHIVPVSRSDIYERLGIDFQFSVSSGLLLASSQHGPLDTYDWSLYVKPDGDLVVHYFNAIGETRQYHGKVIPKSRFRVNDNDEYPNVDMFRWHYRQAVLKNVRGFLVK